LGGTIKDTVGPGTAAGFTNQSAQGRIAYNGTVTFPPGSPSQDGVFAATANGLTFTLGPLTPGQTNSVVALRSDGQSASGAATFTVDGTFFYADLVGNGGNRIFFFGGVPVSQNFFSASSPSNRFLAFAVQPDGALAGVGGQGQTVPFLPRNFGGISPNATVSPLLIVTPANAPFGAAGGPSPKWLQASLAINGQNVGQTSALVVNIGRFLLADDTGTVVGSGQMRGTVSADAHSYPANISSSVHTVPDANGNALFGGAAPTGFVLDQNGFAPALATAAPLGGAAVNYAFNQPALAAPLPSGVGTARVALNETGFFGGLGVSTESGQPVPTALSGTVSLQTDPVGSHVASTFSGRDPFGNGDSTAVLNFGTTAGDGRARSVFIDNNLFAALESPDQPAKIGGTPAPLAGTALAMVTSGAVPQYELDAVGGYPMRLPVLAVGLLDRASPDPGPAERRP
jgi:hypothetical protein